MAELGRPVRVLRIIARLNVGGPARHAAILAAGLHARGYETLLVYGSTSAGEGSLEEVVPARQIEAIKIPELGRSIGPWQDLRALRRILAVMRHWSPDIVHTHTSKAGALGRLAVLVYNATSRRGARCAAIHTFHGHVFEGYFGAFGSRLAQMTERSLARITDRIVTISPRQRHDITTRFAVAPDAKVEVVPLGLELDELLAQPGRSARPISPGRSAALTVGYVGRLVPIKDVASLLRAVELARRELPQLRVVIAGDGESRSDLERLARELGLADVVQFLGWQKDLAALYASMDLFALTSINEGTPVSLIEAMAAGVPVVASAVGGVPDVVTDGLTGTLVTRPGPEAFAAAILKAVREPDHTRDMADRARAAVRERFGAQRLVDDVDTLYRRVLSEARRRRASLNPVR